MSVHNRRLVLLLEARQDLRDILLFTDQRWGREQRRSYRRRIYAVFEQLARFPNLGRLRPEFGPDTFSFLVEQHIVVYRFTAAELIVIRILHARRDADGEFSATTE
jgi:toxin ParE1/3/4